MFNLSPSQVRQFTAVLDKLTKADAAFVDAVDQIAASSAASATGNHHYDEPARRVWHSMGERVSSDVQRGLIAKWMLALPRRVEKERLPRSVLNLYPFWVNHLAQWLSAQTGPYDEDYWAKDVRFALALSVPGNRTQTLDLVSACRPRELARDAFRRGSFLGLARYLLCGGLHKQWLQTHTESRHIDDFNEAGWDRLWETAADICISRPNLAGVIGMSWFFDPPLETISPRLAYLRKIPLAGGAFMADQGPDEVHSERAAATSPTRRALIASGEYVPHSWLLAWPRSSLLAWAQHKQRMPKSDEKRLTA